MRKPRKLRPGDTVAAVTLSWGGPAAFPARYAAGKEQFIKEFGIQVVETRHALRDPAWLAAHPEARAADLMEAFADPSIRGIISTIGGDESIRILPYIDPDVIASNPKVFLGYSDTSGLLFGRPGGQVPVEDFSRYEEAILQVIAIEEGLSALPIVTRMDFGHTDPMLVLPYGVMAEIDSDRQHVEILESAVVNAL
jgi:muramoyltetrapeptide carboxypeptidase LdcA involved in peptidoglycan recycling